MVKKILLLFSFAYLAAGCSVSTQYNNSLKTRSHKFTIAQNGGLVKIETLPVPSSLKPNEKLDYYWYKNDNVHNSTGGYDGKLLDGNYSAYFSNDNLKERGQFVNGLKNGKWMEWYENGKIKSVLNWRNGYKQGVNETYDREGLLETKSEYRKGKLHGKAIIYVRGVDKDIRIYKGGVEVVPEPGKQKEKTPEKKKEEKQKDNKKENTGKEKKENKEEKVKEKSKGKSL